MNEDAPAAPADQTRDRAIGRVVRRNGCLLILPLGAIGGVLVGILNLAAEKYHWTLQDDFFDIVDAPINPLIHPFYAGWTSYRAGWTSYTPNGGSYGFRMVLVEISYWTVIGVFVASLICLVRAGIIQDIARDKICRWLLFFGSCGGMFIGGLGFLAASNGWEDLDNCFNSFNRPVYSVMNAVQYRYNIPYSRLWGSQLGFIYWHSVAVVYWTAIGFFVALIVCAIRIGKKRKQAREVRASEE